MSLQLLQHDENEPNWGTDTFAAARVTVQFNERTGTRFNHRQYPTDIVGLVVLWRVRYQLSLRNLPEMFLERGLVFPHEAVREWEAQLAPLMNELLWKHRRGRIAPSW
ncbi:MAG TPA: hypothetical protein VKJ47_14470 [Candidatus Binatia bacterium]|nr:hypothetical protein [Candidatus Binatia bacterium]